MISFIVFVSIVLVLENLFIYKLGYSNGLKRGGFLGYHLALKHKKLKWGKR